MNRTRDQRRMYLEKKKKQAKRRLERWSKGLDVSEPNPTSIGRVARTPAQCSEYCCGNPRNHYGNGAKTLDEIKAELELEEEIKLLESASDYDFFEFEKMI